MFIDRAKIKIKGGDGGDGHVSFYRAKYIVNGGPDGGDGGDGGDVIFRADGNMTTLMDFRYKRAFAAEPGESGGKKNRSGKNGGDVVITVPVGTVILEAESNKIMADLTGDGQEYVAISGGRGGWGNAHFATSVRQAPRYARPGQKSKGFEVILELKLIADVGIIGFPNVGKSTLLTMITNSKAKVADYHFTTLSPNLGVVRGKARDFILADIPGLIEGASGGAGLGHEFLRHVERTKAFIHVVDISGTAGLDCSPLESVGKINAELAAYDEELLSRPRIIAANKADLLAPEDAERLCGEIRAACPEYRVMTISAAAKTGLGELMAAAEELLKNAPEVTFAADYEEYLPEEERAAAVSVEKQGDTLFSVTGGAVRKMLALTNIDTEKGFAFFQRFLREKGIIARLEELGAKDGDTVKLYDVEFDYWK
ncbi:MAG: GTPase ObgE [Clostridiales bacterium]|jgi:GTP-binding protein|nr:GTPase ObgE [Clostridiales bacterium]